VALNRMMQALLQQALGMPSDNLDPSYTQTPGIIPTSTHPSKMIGFPVPGGPVSGAGTGPVSGAGSEASKPGIFGKIDNFINSPGGGFLMNLLSQQGYSPVPQSPFGAIGRAGLMSQAQGQQRQRGELENELLRAQAGLAKAKTTSEGMPGGGDIKAATDLGKLTQDLANGVISQEDYAQKRKEILSVNQQQGFTNEKVLRDEFTKRTLGISTSLQAASQAEALLSTSANPIAEMAAFISLIKSIDNSTVREGELNNFSRVSGIMSELQTLATRAAGEGAFAPGVREDIQASLAALRANLEKMHSGFSEYYGSEAKRYNLSPRAVIGGPIPGFGGSGNPQAPPPAKSPNNVITPPQDEDAEDFT